MASSLPKRMRTVICHHDLWTLLWKKDPVFFLPQYLSAIGHPAFFFYPSQQDSEHNLCDMNER